MKKSTLLDILAERDVHPTKLKVHRDGTVTVKRSFYPDLGDVQLMQFERRVAKVLKPKQTLSWIELPKRQRWERLGFMVVKMVMA